MVGWYDRICQALDTCGYENRTWSCEHGRLLLTSHGARLLACEMPGVGGNLFWHNIAIESADTAHQPMQTAWGELGGDRLGIAPEVGHMWSDFDQARHDPFAAYVVPPEMDPADYHIAEEGPGHLRLNSKIELSDHRDGKRIGLDVDRRFDLALPPPDLPASVKCVSFTIRNSLAILEADDGAVAGAWNLLQVPPTGTLICPTFGPAQMPTCYFDPFGDRHVRCAGHAVYFLIDSSRVMKMAISPLQTTGRMGFYRPLNGISTLIVRIISVFPGEPYVDMPRSRDRDERFAGDALQAFNYDRLPPDGFGEMEHHEPAVVAGQSPSSKSHASVTHVLAGPDDDVRKFGRQLLGVDVVMID